MRRWLFPTLLALAVAACHRDASQGAGDTARSEGSRGPDPILIRLPRSGGTARAFLFPRLDSAIWSGHTTSVERVLGFDPEGGALAVADAKGNPARVDLHMGDASTAARAQLTSLTAPNGNDIYGIDPHGSVVRLTRAGTWSYTPPAPARDVFAQQNGSIVIAGQRGDEAVLWRMFPPETRIRDTARLAATVRGPHAQSGDRIYFGTDTALVTVRTRDLALIPAVHTEHRVAALAPTPSGDRVYFATAGDSTVSVVDRYSDRVAARIKLPSDAAELRMDRLGRYVFARPAHGDSAWVIAIATNHVIGAARTRWSEDLPTAAPDGEIVVSVGRDVLLLDGETLQPLRTVAGGAADYWYFISWDGFRTRANASASVTFASADSGAGAMAASDTAAGAATAATDSAPAANAQQAAPAARSSAPAPAPAAQPPTRAPAPAVAPVAAAPRPQPGTTPPATPAASTETTSTPGSAAAGATPELPYNVQFAAMTTDAAAHALADSIRIDGATPRVVPIQRAGATLYRVVMGPYPSRAAAERIGRESKRSYWVFTGQP